jgi:hypothetical protein
LILYPLCEPHVLKTLHFWEETKSKTKTAASGYSHHSLLHSITFEGSQGIVDACAHIFDQLPDNTIVYHSERIQITDHQDDDNTNNSWDYLAEIPATYQGLIVKIPYSYFFHVPFTVTTAATTAAALGGHLRHSSAMIDVELQGCLELTFSSDSQDVIAHIYDHVMLVASPLFPSLTMTQVMQYMAYRS